MHARHITLDRCIMWSECDKFQLLKMNFDFKISIYNIKMLMIFHAIILGTTLCTQCWDNVAHSMMILNIPTHECIKHWIHTIFLDHENSIRKAHSVQKIHHIFLFLFWACDLTQRFLHGQIFSKRKHVLNLWALWSTGVYCVVSHAKTTLRFVLAAAKLVCNGFQIDTLCPKILICRCSRWSLSRVRAAARGQWRENQKFAIRSETSQLAAASQLKLSCSN